MPRLMCPSWRWMTTSGTPSCRGHDPRLRSVHPAWLLNMAKHPDDIWLEVGTERFKVRGDSLEGPERAEALARIAAIASRYGNTKRRPTASSHRATDPRAVSERRRARRPAAACACQRHSAGGPFASAPLREKR